MSQFFFLYVYSEDVVSSTPTENYIHFENSGFEQLSLKTVGNKVLNNNNLNHHQSTQLESLYLIHHSRFFRWLHTRAVKTTHLSTQHYVWKRIRQCRSFHRKILRYFKTWKFSSGIHIQRKHTEISMASTHCT